MAPFRLAIVAGVMPGRWTRTWEQRHPGAPLEVTLVEEADQVAVLHGGRADMAFVRLPVERTGLHVIPLWQERAVVVVPRDHVISAFDAVESADLSDEAVLEGLDPRTAVEAVAAGTGVAVMPGSVARLHRRTEVRAVPVSDLPPTRIGLAWLVANEDPRVQQFVGIVRGRTPRSSR